MDYDEVVSQAVVWQGAVPAASDTATAAVVTQDPDNKASAGEEWHAVLGQVCAEVNSLLHGCFLHSS